MKWFKHMTLAYEEAYMAAVVDELGMEGYGVVWRIVEILAAKYDTHGEVACSFSARKWGKTCNMSAKKFLKLAEKLHEISENSRNSGKNSEISRKSGKFSEIQLIFLEISENSIMVSLPSLLKLKDNYTANNTANLQVSDKSLDRKLFAEEKRIEEKRREIGEGGVGEEPSLPPQRGGASPLPDACFAQESPEQGGLMPEPANAEQAARGKPRKRDGPEASGSAPSNEPCPDGNSSTAQAAAEKGARDPCPYEAFVSLYHANFKPPHPQVAMLTPKRQMMLKARWRDIGQRLQALGKATAREDKLAWLEKFCVKAASSDFLTGKTANRDSKPFLADFDFLFSPKGFCGVIEGKYKNFVGAA